MPNARSANYKKKTRATGGAGPSFLLEITHAALAQPIRVTNDRADIVSGGNNFVACAFRVRFPDDVAGVMPRVPISIDNIGRELTQWLEASDGGRGASFRLMEVMRDTPNVIEQEFTMKLLRASQNVLEVSGDLGVEDVMSMMASAEEYTPETAPGLF